MNDDDVKLVLPRINWKGNSHSNLSFLLPFSPLPSLSSDKKGILVDRKPPTGKIENDTCNT